MGEGKGNVDALRIAVTSAGSASLDRCTAACVRPGGGGASSIEGQLWGGGAGGGGTNPSGGGALSTAGIFSSAMGGGHLTWPEPGAGVAAGGTWAGALNESLGLAVGGGKPASCLSGNVGGAGGSGVSRGGGGKAGTSADMAGGSGLILSFGFNPRLLAGGGGTASEVSDVAGDGAGGNFDSVGATGAPGGGGVPASLGRSRNFGVFSSLMFTPLAIFPGRENKKIPASGDFLSDNSNVAPTAARQPARNPPNHSGHPTPLACQR